MKRHGALVARALASLALIVLVLWKAGASEVLATLRGAAPAGVGLVVLLHTGDRLLMAYKWRRLLLARGLRLGLGEAIRAYYVSSFAGVFLPMTVGADLVRVGALRRSAVPARHLVASIALERALGALSQGLFCLLSLALIVATRLHVRISTESIGVVVLGLLAALTAALPLSFGVAAAIARAGRGRGGWRGQAASLAREYAAWREHPAELRRFLALTLLEGLFPIVTYLAAAHALGKPATLVQMAALVPLVYLIARLPVSVAGIGPEQTAYTAAAAALFGAPEASAAAVSFLVSPITLLVALLPGAAAWVWVRRQA